MWHASHLPFLAPSGTSRFNRPPSFPIGARSINEILHVRYLRLCVRGRKGRPGLGHPPRHSLGGRPAVLALPGLRCRKRGFRDGGSMRGGQLVNWQLVAGQSEDEGSTQGEPPCSGQLPVASFPVGLFVGSRRVWRRISSSFHSGQYPAPSWPVAQQHGLVLRNLVPFLL
jgi:hypothetical protein